MDPLKRKQLIELVKEGQKTIKEAANRLKINYSTAKHIIKSKKSEAPERLQAQGSNSSNRNFENPMKHSAPVDIEQLERKIKALTESTPSIFQSRLGEEPSKTFNSSLLSTTSLSLGQSLSKLCP